MFTDRKEAGEKLGIALSGYRNKKNVLVLGIPRGGAETAYYVAQYLNAEFSLIISRKLRYPTHPEAVFGAVSEEGSIYLSRNADNVPREEISDIICREKKEIERRINSYRKGMALPDLKDKIVILVDDGIATGSTLFAAIDFCHRKKPSKIIVAVPVSSQEIAFKIKMLVNDVVILELPSFFYSVSQVYSHFYDLTDEEVTHLFDMYANNHVMQS